LAAARAPLIGHELVGGAPAFLYEFVEGTAFVAQVAGIAVFAVVAVPGARFARILVEKCGNRTGVAGQVTCWGNDQMERG